MDVFSLESSDLEGIVDCEKGVDEEFMLAAVLTLPFGAENESPS